MKTTSYRSFSFLWFVSGMFLGLIFLFQIPISDFEFRLLLNLPGVFVILRTTFYFIMDILSKWGTAKWKELGNGDKRNFGTSLANYFIDAASAHVGLAVIPLIHAVATQSSGSNTQLCALSLLVALVFYLFASVIRDVMPRIGIEKSIL
ncbi:MAG TPA: hypothetical protein VIY48_04305 [Candidatus Paceibacterota bacterium]